MLLRESFLKKTIKIILQIGVFLSVFLLYFWLFVFFGFVGHSGSSIPISVSEWIQWTFYLLVFSFIPSFAIFFPLIVTLVYFDRYPPVLKIKSKKIIWKFTGVVLLISLCITLIFYFYEAIRHSGGVILFGSYIAKAISLQIFYIFAFLGVEAILALIVAEVIYRFGYKKED